MKRAYHFLRKTKRIFLALIGLVFIMLWASGVLRSRQAPGTLEPERGVPLPPEAHVLTVAKESIPEWVPLSGTVQSERQIQMSARLPAYIDAVHVVAGTAVKAGDLLVELDQRELIEKRAAAQANLNQAETAFQRSSRLLETQATTPQAHEAAESAYQAARAQLDQVNVLLSHTRITAPIDGIVSDRFLEAGDLASPGQALLTLYDPERLRLEVPVPASLIEHFPIGRVLPVSLDTDTISRTATVREVVSAFDPVTRTRRVKLALDKEGPQAFPGMYGEVHVPIANRDAILLPAGAVHRTGQLELVLIVRDGHTYRRLVRTTPAADGQVIILSGLLPGEQVLLPGTANDPVTPQPKSTHGSTGQ